MIYIIGTALHYFKYFRRKQIVIIEFSHNAAPIFFNRNNVINFVFFKSNFVIIAYILNFQLITLFPKHVTYRSIILLYSSTVMFFLHVSKFFFLKLFFQNFNKFVRMFFRIAHFHKCAVSPDDRLAVAEKFHGFCGSLYCVSASLNKHKTFTLNDLHQRIINKFRELNFTRKSQIICIKTPFCFLLFGRGKKNQRRIFQV